MKIATIAPLTYTPGKLEYFQFIRGGVGADYHQGPAFHQFADSMVRMTWGAYDFDECSPNVVALYSDSRDRGLTWSAPQVYMADYPAGPLGGPVLVLQADRLAGTFGRFGQLDRYVDPATAARQGFTDPFLQVMPDGWALRMLRADWDTVPVEQRPEEGKVGYGYFGEMNAAD